MPGETLGRAKQSVAFLQNNVLRQRREGKLRICLHLKAGFLPHGYFLPPLLLPCDEQVWALSNGFSVHTALSKEGISTKGFIFPSGPSRI